MEIGRVVLIAELDNKTHLIALPQDKLKILVSLAASLTETGKLPVKHMPDYIFTEINTEKP